MTYLEAMDFLESTKQYGSVLGLESIRALMEQLGNIQDTLPIIHVAGTNGKGSTSAFLSAIYQAAGYHVCRFATPDVFCYEEEFLYNDEPISREELGDVFEVVADACDALVCEGHPHPTRFEVETATAFLWFSKKKPDICIVEVGMGGETDATNIISKPLVSVLTAISRDHVGFLGKTVEEIAGVKAGIIKTGCPVVSTWQEPVVEAVIEKRAALKGARLHFSTKTKFALELSLKGTFQQQNATLALDVIDCLQGIFPVPQEAVSLGLSHAKWPGRFECIGTDPEVYIDGAHNIAAAKMLRETIDAEFDEQPVIYIMGVLEDKDYEDIAEIMLRDGDTIYCVTPNNPRALSARELVDAIYELELDIRAYECKNVDQAVETAVEFAQLTDRTVVAFGSLSYLKEVKDAYQGMLIKKED